MHISSVILLLLWLQDLSATLAAPARANLTAELFSLQLSRRPRLSSEDFVDYLIPGTTVKIHFMLGAPLSQSAMRTTIISAYNNITSTIASSGDSILPKSEDPWVYSGGYGVFIATHSAKGRHLTWSLLEGVTVGLYNGLYLRERYRESSFWIWDGTAGLVGVGEMEADVVGHDGGGNGTVNWKKLIEIGEGNSNGSNNIT